MFRPRCCAFRGRARSPLRGIRAVPMPTPPEDIVVWLPTSRAGLGALAFEPIFEHIGRVVQIGDGVAMVRGLPEARLDELLVFENGVRALAVALGGEAAGWR